MSNIDHDVRSRRCKLVLSRHCLWLPFGRAHKRGHPKVSEAAIVGYRRFRDRLPPAARIPGVGLIEAGPAGLTARVVPLTRPIRAAP